MFNVRKIIQTNVYSWLGCCQTFLWSRSLKFDWF